ncbi:MAG: hypothetical protein WBP81_25805 [Solirubrobacteraceae bacterium]
MGDERAHEVRAAGEQLEADRAAAAVAIDVGRLVCNRIQDRGGVVRVQGNRNVRRARGSSWVSACPPRWTLTKRAPGMRSAIARESSYGAKVSSSEAMTSAGTVIDSNG